MRRYLLCLSWPCTVGGEGLKDRDLVLYKMAVFSFIFALSTYSVCDCWIFCHLHIRGWLGKESKKSYKNTGFFSV